MSRPDVLRRRNFIKPKQMPYTTATEKIYDTGEFAQPHGARASSLPIGTASEARTRRSKAKGLLRGIGIATYIEACGNMRRRHRDDEAGTRTAA